MVVKDSNLEEKKQNKQQQKKIAKKKLSEALRKNLMRRKNLEKTS